LKSCPAFGPLQAIQSSQFSPANLEVRVGTTVTWTNNDGVMHTVTSDSGVFDSGYLSNGDTFTFTFTEAGTFPYITVRFIPT